MKPNGWGRILAAHPVQRCPTPTGELEPSRSGGCFQGFADHCHASLSWADEQLRKPLTQHAKNYQTTNRRPQATPLLSNSGIRSGCCAHPSAGKPFWPRPRGRWKVSQAWQSNHTVFKLHWQFWNDQINITVFTMCFHANWCKRTSFRSFMKASWAEVSPRSQPLAYYLCQVRHRDKPEDCSQDCNKTFIRQQHCRSSLKVRRSCSWTFGKNKRFW